MTTAYRPHPGDPYVETSPTDLYAGDLLSVAAILDRADGWWRDCAERALRELAGRGTDFTTDDLREMGVPDLDNPREQAARWGSLLAAAKTEGRIREVGRRPSTRPSANGRKISVWQGVTELAEVS